jgi:uncharacterized protein YfaS (alpha-2-macroglobulin family)
VLRRDDRAEIVAVVDNLTGPAGTVTVTAKTAKSGPFALTSTKTATRKIEKGAQIRIPFELEAKTLGKGEITLTAQVSDDEGTRRASDQVTRPLEVVPSLVQEMTKQGSLDGEIPGVLTIKIPKDALRGYGALYLSFSSAGFALRGLEGAFEFLVGYPNGCVEQTSSRLLPLIALGDLAEKYPLGVGDVDEFVAAGVDRLGKMQRESGGFAYWPDSSDVRPYYSAYATWVLTLAGKAGYPLPGGMLKQARKYLRSETAAMIEENSGTQHLVHAAMALHALSEGGIALAEAFDRLFEKRDRLPTFARALLAVALHNTAPDDSRLTHMKIALFKTGKAIRAGQQKQGPLLQEVFDSSIRTEAIVLYALAAIAPDHPETALLARHLLDRRRGGRWGNTQENAHALLALAQYERSQTGKEESRFEAAAWLKGARPILTWEQRKGGAPFSEAVSIPLDRIRKQANGDTAVLLIEKRGPGKLYYNAKLSYASDRSKDKAENSGVVLERRLRVARGSTERAKSVPQGQPVALDVKIECQRDLSYMSLEIPLPAGLEAIENRHERKDAANSTGGATGEWVSHTDSHKDRVTLFADALRPGVHEHTVYLRAATRGTYTMPGAKAASMYYPGIFGTTSSDTLKVE